MNKKKFLTVLFFFTAFISLNAQELDDSFLDTLPDDIKKDVMQRSANNAENLENNYSAYQYSSKLKQEEEFNKLKIRLESDLKELEKRLANEDNQAEDLELFGSDFFSTFQTSFMPINEPNPDSSYTLDVGDILNIQLIGQRDYIEKFPINNDGSINLPDIGSIVVVGLTLSETSGLIKSKVGSTFIGTDAFVSLDKIRDVNILVTGNAKNPGIYTLTGNSNILHAISAAGGISEFGSYREINLIRNNTVVEKLDIYDLLIDGNYNLQKRLRSGDVIFVESTKNIVTIDGAVKRPGLYEVLDGQYLFEVIEYANGMKQTADLENISLERILDGSLKTIPVVNENQFKNIIPVDGDLIYVREFPYRKAKISGAVQKPGQYILANGETLNDLIDKAGGFNTNADLFGAVYLNEQAKEVNKISKDLLYREFIDTIISASLISAGANASTDLGLLVNLTSELRNTEPNGRIVVDLLNENSLNQFGIREGDELIIPETNNNVYVYGEVSNEAALMFASNEDVEYFIEKSGGYKKSADIESIFVLHPNGETQRYSMKRNVFESKPKNDIKIYPGSIIFVPKKLDESAARTLAAQAYVSILGSLGIALASLSSINNN